MSRLTNALSGITTPLVTPFDEDQLDLAAYDAVLEHVLAAGVDAVFPGGTTGEVASLSMDERRTLVEHTIATTPSDIPVITGGTGTNIDDTLTWIDEVAAFGVDAIVVTAPYFHPSNDPTGFEPFFEEIASKSPVPVLLYNIPACVGDAIPIDVVTEIANHPNIIGLKDSSGDLAYGITIQDTTPDDFLLLQGFDALLVPSLRMGFDGGVNAVSNVIPEVYVDIVQQPHGDHARHLHRTAIAPVFELCRQHGFAAGVKAALCARDVITHPDVRPPLRPVSPDDATDSVNEAISTL